MDGARWVRPQTTIILRSARELGDVPLDASQLTVEGTQSGLKEGRLVLSDDERTVIFKPRTAFDAGERVTVTVKPGVLGRQDVDSAFVFSFTISQGSEPGDPLASIRSELEQARLPFATPSSQPPPLPSSAADTLPLDFPYLSAEVLGQPEQGRIFACNFGGASTAASYLMILENSASPLYYKKLAARGFDFTLQPNGLLTYYDQSDGCFLALNSLYVVVDTFRCGNGYSTDLHELQVLPDGHAFLMSYDVQTVDMSTIVPGGKKNAKVTGLVVQELDQSKNVVFQWRSWDHFNIQDATHEDLTAETIDYVHGNAIQPEDDGTILLSSRHLDEITKIDTETGEIIWRLGGKHNEFRFINDPIGFSHQHDIRRLPNGDITFFDNGNYHSPPFSRAVEYRLDETNKAAELVWQYRHTPDIYGSAMGNVQRLPGGNTLICWGTGGAITEVGPDGSKVLEMRFSPGVYSYRAFRFDWQPEIFLDPVDVPAADMLQPNYPNPFNAVTSIQVDLPVDSYASLKVFDILGRQVASLFEGMQRAGVYTARFDATALSSGIYFYRLVTGNFTQTRRMILMK
jgi:hypothetical protein